MNQLVRDRVDWVDAAKGLCIILVVMMHATLGVGLAMNGEGFMHAAVAFARPFRMPDFFLISGLFLALVIDRPWQRYLDRKVLHFAYFYVLWLLIQFAFKAPRMAMEEGLSATLQTLALAFIQPFGTLWFIYILPIFFLFTRMVRGLPVWFVFAWAASLQILPIHTGWLIFDEFCERYVFFFAGYAFAATIFALADRFSRRPVEALACLALWAPLNALLVFTPAPSSLAFLIQPGGAQTGGTGGWAELPSIGLGLGFAGATAIVAVAVLATRIARAGWLTWLGARSIVVYLAFFLPMAASRVILVKSGLIDSVGLISLLVMLAGVTGPVLLYLLIEWSGYGRFLFERPRWARLERTPPAAVTSSGPLAASEPR